MPSQSPGRALHAVEHYENFPVASWLMSPSTRPAVVAIYRFARHADDIADEGQLDSPQRREALGDLRAALLADDRAHPIVGPVLAVAAQYALPLAPFLALLSAFDQDVDAAWHRDDASLLDYCARSANPVGELVLRLHGCWSPTTRGPSDAICTALQLINFVQDVGIDWARGRSYIPDDALAAGGLDASALERALRLGYCEAALVSVLASRGAQARAMLDVGHRLLAKVPLRLSLELRFVMAGANRILDKLEHTGWDPVRERPRLSWRDAPALLWRALLPLSAHRASAGADTAPGNRR